MIWYNWNGLTNATSAPNTVQDAKLRMPVYSDPNLTKIRISLIYLRSTYLAFLKIAYLQICRNMQRFALSAYLSHVSAHATVYLFLHYSCISIYATSCLYIFCIHMWHRSYPNMWHMCAYSTHMSHTFSPYFDKLCTFSCIFAPIRVAHILRKKNPTINYLL